MAGTGGFQLAPVYCACRGLLTGADTPTSSLCHFVCWAIASRSLQAQLQLHLLQEAFGTSQDRAAVSSDDQVALT